MDKPLLFLLKLAWACRYRLPLLITIGFMALDIRMQLEIHVQMRRIQRDQIIQNAGRQHQNNSQRNRNNSEGSSSSWITIDDDDNSDIVQEMLLYSDSDGDTEFHETTMMQTHLRDINVEN